MKVGIIVFPGSNCDHDAWYAINKNLHGNAAFIWHDSPSLGDADAVILPGGFSYGDYLRCGAIARFSPVMQAVKKFAADGGLVLGVCNGFQILVEAGLLPGALLRNTGLKFICREVTLRTVTVDSPFTSRLREGEVLRVPIAKAGTSPTMPHSIGSKPKIASPSVMSKIPTGRRAISRASSTASAM
jgi:phosphoribosylformylglycinamidine synthase subunit PurQ / glutaminase